MDHSEQITAFLCRSQIGFEGPGDLYLPGHQRGTELGRCHRETRDNVTYLLRTCGAEPGVGHWGPLT